MPGTFSPSPWVSDPDMHHGTCVMHARIVNWRFPLKSVAGKRFPAFPAHVQPAIDQSHRYGRPKAACREPAGSYDKTTRTAICVEHKTQYLLIRAPYTRIVVFRHISNVPPMISQSQISCNTPTFYYIYLWNIAIQPAVGCYNSWANLRCSGCYPLGENYCETGLLRVSGKRPIGVCGE